MSSTSHVLIQPRTGWQTIDFKELWRYRELLGFFVWRDIKIRYKQTLLGSLWAIIQPVIGMIIFGLVFGRVLHLRNDGPPYLLFVYAGLVPWTFFANAVALSSNSLIGSEQLIRKTYFPRLMVPLGTTVALGLDMVVNIAFMTLLMAYYRWPLTPAIIWLPVFIVGCYLIAGGLGLFLSALNVQYRDIKYVVPFCIQMGFFLTPVIYPTDYFPAKMRILFVLNPMAGLVDGFRHALLGSPILWPQVSIALLVSTVVFLAGVFFFRRMERQFADVI